MIHVDTIKVSVRLGCAKFDGEIEFGSLNFLYGALCYASVHPKDMGSIRGKVNQKIQTRLSSAGKYSCWSHVIDVGT